MKFAITFNGEREMGDLLGAYASDLADVAFYPPSVRSVLQQEGGAAEQAYAVRLHEFLGAAKNAGPALMAAFDALCVEDDRPTAERVAGLRDELVFYGRAYGVRMVRVSSPLDGRAIKAMLPDVRVCCSANMLVSSVQHLEQVRDFADLIVLDRDINPDLNAIREIRKRFDGEIRLLANEGCVYRCLNRIQHLNRQSHGGGAAVGPLPCRAAIERDPTLERSPIIRPESVGRYADVADVLQLETGPFATRVVATILEAYATGVYQGRICDIVASPGVHACMDLPRGAPSAETATPYDDLMSGKPSGA